MFTVLFYYFFYLSLKDSTHQNHEFCNVMTATKGHMIVGCDVVYSGNAVATFQRNLLQLHGLLIEEISMIL